MTLISNNTRGIPGDNLCEIVNGAQDDISFTQGYLNTIGQDLYSLRGNGDDLKNVLYRIESELYNNGDEILKLKEQVQELETENKQLREEISDPMKLMWDKVHSFDLE